MNRRANFQKSYRNRYLLFVLVFIPGALYFFYDGFIGYPSKLPAARAYDAMKDLQPKEREDKWKELAKTNGWPTKIPTKTAEEWESAITGQYFWGTLTAIAGGIALAYYLGSKNAWVERTEKGITTSWNQNLEFERVVKLDKKKWEAKGIAKATYFESGKKKIFTFDDFKFEREPLDIMLYELEQTLRPEQIVGGPAEEMPAALKPKPVEETGNSTKPTPVADNAKPQAEVSS